MYNYDLVVVGAGPGGYVAALEAAKLGMKVAVIERQEVGGTCLNRGCIPTKTLLHEAELMTHFRQSVDRGIAKGSFVIQMEGLRQRKEEVVKTLQDGITGLLKKEKVTCITGTAQILSAHQVNVMADDEHILTAKYILIATGSRPAKLPVQGIDLPGVMDSDAALRWDYPLPKRMVIIGGGVIGMEFASLYHALGVQVTVLEAAERILPNMDREFSQNLKMIMKKRNIDVHTTAYLQAIERAQSGELVCHYTEKDTACVAEADFVLVAVGRKPNIDEVLHPDLTILVENGYIQVNEQYQTSVPSVYAIGDVIGGMQLAHKASAEGICAASHMAGKERHAHMELIPSCVYTSPEIASVGITAEEAKKAGLSVDIQKYSMSANAKTIINGQDRSFLRIITERKSGKILGAQMMCDRATDMIGEMGSAIANELTVKQLAGVIRPHPTYNEAVWEMAREV